MSSVRRFKLTVEYDGTEFAGFQLQGQGERTVQGVLESALRKLAGSKTTVHGAGRTDTGVHARGQVVHFDSDWSVPGERLARVLNGVLPADLSVRSACEVESAFHARFSARQRTYLYLIWNGDQRSALWGRYSTHEPKKLDIVAMSAAAEELRGKHDFSSFANRSAVTPPSMVRELRQFDVRRASRGKFVVIRASADGFLRSMVRNLVGGLISVGVGDLKPSRLYEIVRLEDRVLNPCQAAPPQGLCLWRVDY